MHRLLNKTYKIIVLTFLLVFSAVTNSFGQVSNCGNASQIVVNSVSCSQLGATHQATLNADNITTVTTCVINNLSTFATEKWYYFVATATTATITGTQTDPGDPKKQLALIIYSGSCGSLSQIGCANNITSATAQTETATVSLLTVGNTYFVRVINEGDGTSNPNTSVGCLLIKSAPDNDEANNAEVLPIGACGAFIQANTINATNSSSCGSIPNPTCGNFTPGSLDIWYSVTVPNAPNNNLVLETAQIGSAKQFEMALYTGVPCGTMTQYTCTTTGSPNDPSLMPGLSLESIPPGVYYIRIWKKNSYGAFNIRACTTITKPANDEPCNASVAIPSSGTTCGTPYNTNITGATASLPLNGCGIGSPNYDVWVKFQATSTSHTITMSGFTYGVSPAPSTSSSQNMYMSLYSGTCSSLGSEIKCEPANTGVIGALTVGATYYIRFFNELKLPGFATSFNYCITSPTPLPIELISFKGLHEAGVNNMEWVTLSELNNDYYILEKSSNGIDFEKLSQIRAYGTGTSSSKQLYAAQDSKPNADITYYRLKQVDKDGRFKYYQIISVIGPDYYETISKIYPNPTSSDLNLEYNSKSINNIKIDVVDFTGSIVSNISLNIDEGKNNLVVPMSQLSNGVYTLKVVSSKSGKTTYHKVVKN